MSHYAGISLENFRAFPGRIDLEFAPITVLTGTNGSGKSAIIRALKLIQTNFAKLTDEMDFFEVLDFRQGDHQLGNFRSSVNRQHPEEPLTIRFPFSLIGMEDPLQIAFSFEEDLSNGLHNGRLCAWEVVVAETEHPILHAELVEEEWRLKLDFRYWRGELDRWIQECLEIELTGAEYYKKRYKEIVEKEKEKPGADVTKFSGPLASAPISFHTKKRLWKLHFLIKSLERNGNKLRTRYDSYHDLNFKAYFTWATHLHFYSHLGFNLFDPSGFRREDINHGFSLPAFPHPNGGSYPTAYEFDIREYKRLNRREPRPALKFLRYNPSMPLLIYWYLVDEEVTKTHPKADELVQIRQEHFLHESLEEWVGRIKEEELELLTGQTLFFLRSPEQGSNILRNVWKWLSSASWNKAENHGDSQILELQFIEEMKDEFAFNEAEFFRKDEQAFLEEEIKDADFQPFDFGEADIGEKKEEFEISSSEEETASAETPIPESMEEEQEFDFYPRDYSKNLEYFFDHFIFNNLKNSLRLLFQKHAQGHSLPSIRAISKRIYSESGREAELNALINAYQRAQPKAEAVEFFEHWLQEFGIGDRIEIEQVGDGFGYQIYLHKGEERQLLSDHGYGYTQLLPILLKVLLLSDQGPTVLIIEEPETNLHPQLQSKLADFFVEASKKFYLQFILETHSEYLIRKLQVLTAKGTISPYDTAIYYCYAPGQVPEGKSQVQRLRIKTDGGLDHNFGPGFFDEAVNWQLELLRLKNRQN